MYLRDSDVTPHLDAWILSVFGPKNLDARVAALAAAQSPGANVLAEAARRAVADCDTRLAKYRSTLEAGADPIVVVGWIKEVEADPLAPQRELASTVTAAQPASEAEIRALVTSQRQRSLGTLAGATPEHRAAIYGQAMGLRVTYNPSTELDIEARPDTCTRERVGEGTLTINPPPIWATEVAA